MFSMIKVQWQRITSHPGKIFVYLILPVILFAVGIQVSFSQQEFVYYLLDEDQTEVSRIYMDAFDTDNFGQSRADVEQKVINQEAHFGIIIPEGFTEQLLAGTPNIDVYSIDKPEASIMAEMRLNGLTESMLALDQTNAADLARAYHETFDDGLSFSIEPIEVNRVQGMQFGSGFILMMLAFNGFQIALLLLQDRQLRTLARIRQTPIPSLHMIFSTMIVGGFILLLNILAVFLLNHFLFKVQANFFTYLLLYLGALIFLILGLYISLTVRSSSAVSALQTIVIVPTSMLSGAFWPFGLMPDFMQKLAMLTPQYWAIKGVADLIRSSGGAVGSGSVGSVGSGGSDVGSMFMGLVGRDTLIHLAVLAAFLALFVVLLAARLKTMEDTEAFA